jgi:L-ribulokinase
VAAGAAAGGYDTITDAAKKMARLRDTVFRPNKGAHVMYEKLYAVYRRLHDLFGRGRDNAMKELKAIRQSFHE